MTESSETNQTDAHVHMSVGQIALIIVLCGLLVLACAWAALVWTSSGTVAISTHGWIALSLGLFFSLAIGCGLMALMFYSSRSGYDDVATPTLRKREGESPTSTASVREQPKDQAPSAL